MPLTPFHLGAGLFFGAITFRFFNLWALLLGSIAMDIEPAILLVLKNCYRCPHHGILHSILGAILGSLILGALLWKFRAKLDRISLKFKIHQSFSFPNLFFSSFSAWLIHIFFDSLTHNDVFPFWPSKYNPILIGPEVYWPLSIILLIFGIIGLILILFKIKHLKSERGRENHSVSPE